MESGLYKTITFVCFILIGVFLKRKIRTKNERNGIKAIILNLALPATIFIALLGVKVDGNLLFLPLLALVLNFLLFLVVPFVLPMLGFQKDSAKFRTAQILVPSLAPGLSCFPFVLEFLGEEALAKAAMADLGNKLFVLVGLYIVAMNWHYRYKNSKKKEKGKILSLLKVLISEPVNLFIGAALVLITFGFTMNSLPTMIGDILQKLSLIMTPLVLLFIGLGIKFKRKQFFQIFSMLSIRAGIVFIVSGVFILVTGLQSLEAVLLLLAFGLSACSFWPYAHISAVEHLEAESEKKKTFDGDFALNVLALSFPFSTILILGVLNTEQMFSSYTNILIAGVVLFIAGLLFPLLGKLKPYLPVQKPVKTKIAQRTPEHI